MTLPVTVNWIVENRSGAFDAGGTAHRSSHIPEFNVVGFLLWGSFLIILNLQLKWPFHSFTNFIPPKHHSMIVVRYYYYHYSGQVWLHYFQTWPLFSIVAWRSLNIIWTEVTLKGQQYHFTLGGTQPAYPDIYRATNSPWWISQNLILTQKVDQGRFTHSCKI